MISVSIIRLSGMPSNVATKYFGHCIVGKTSRMAAIWPKVKR